MLCSPAEGRARGMRCLSLRDRLDATMMLPSQPVLCKESPSHLIDASVAHTARSVCLASSPENLPILAFLSEPSARMHLTGRRESAPWASMPPRSRCADGPLTPEPTPRAHRRRVLIASLSFWSMSHPRRDPILYRYALVATSSSFVSGFCRRVQSHS